MLAYHKSDKYVKIDMLSAYLKLQDLCYLLALREEGFGEDRLRRVVENGRNIYKVFRDRYCVGDDLKNLTESAPHLIAMEEELKNSGYDYEEEQRKTQADKYRFHGNQFTL